MFKYCEFPQEHQQYSYFLFPHTHAHTHTHAGTHAPNDGEVHRGHVRYAVKEQHER